MDNQEGQCERNAGQSSGLTTNLNNSNALCSNKRYHPIISRDWASSIKSVVKETFSRHINGKKSTERETAEFVLEIHNKLIAIHEYNLQVANRERKYPTSKQFDSLLIRYVELEFETLYKNGELDAKLVEDRVLHLLNNIMYDIFNNCRRKTNAASKNLHLGAILKLLANVKPEYRVENKFISSIIIKILREIGLFSHLDSFISQFSLDNYLNNSARRHFTTSDYGTEDSDSDVFSDCELEFFNETKTECPSNNEEHLNSTKETITSINCDRNAQRNKFLYPPPSKAIPAKDDDIIVICSDTDEEDKCNKSDEKVPLNNSNNVGVLTIELDSDGEEFMVYRKKEGNVRKRGKMLSKNVAKKKFRPTCKLKKTVEIDKKIKEISDSDIDTVKVENFVKLEFSESYTGDPSCVSENYDFIKNEYEKCKKEKMVKIEEIVENKENVIEKFNNRNISKNAFKSCDLNEIDDLRKSVENCERKKNTMEETSLNRNRKLESVEKRKDTSKKILENEMFCKELKESETKNEELARNRKEIKQDVNYANVKSENCVNKGTNLENKGETKITYETTSQRDEENKTEPVENEQNTMKEIETSFNNLSLININSYFVLNKCKSNESGLKNKNDTSEDKLENDEKNKENIEIERNGIEMKQNTIENVEFVNVECDLTYKEEAKEMWEIASQINNLSKENLEEYKENEETPLEQLDSFTFDFNDKQAENKVKLKEITSEEENVKETIFDEDTIDNPFEFINRETLDTNKEVKDNFSLESESIAEEADLSNTQKGDSSPLLNLDWNGDLCSTFMSEWRQFSDLFNATEAEWTSQNALGGPLINARSDLYFPGGVNVNNAVKSCLDHNNDLFCDVISSFSEFGDLDSFGILD